MYTIQNNSISSSITMAALEKIIHQDSVIELFFIGDPLWEAIAAQLYFKNV
jgi:hypothetical protein